MVVGFVQLVPYHSDATCVAPLPSSSRKRFTILQSSVVYERSCARTERLNHKFTALSSVANFYGLWCVSNSGAATQNLFWVGQILILREQQHFVWDTTSQSTKWLDVLKILGEHGPLGPPGYAYGVKIDFEQEELVLRSIWHLTMKHTLTISL